MRYCSSKTQTIPVLILQNYTTQSINSAQVRIKSTAAHYFPLGKSQRSVFKTALNAGYFQSRNFFGNELFQLGGYKLLRGFDEESQYLSRYAIATLEYHYLVGRNSYFYVLADGGWGRGLMRETKLTTPILVPVLGWPLKPKQAFSTLPGR
jgi:hemolysin activation/secretion protein